MVVRVNPARRLSTGSYATDVIEWGKSNIMEEAKKKKILVVDDEESARKPLVEELKFQNFVVHEAVNGEEGLKLAMREKPDLILLDIAMPKMTGLDVIRELRKDSWGRHVPVIFITQLPADDLVMKQIILSEPSYYLMKNDWKIEDVMEKVNDCLKSKAVEAPTG